MTDIPPPATPQLGRLEEFDERSRAFPIRALFSAAKKPRSYTWNLPAGVQLDQGATSSCVGHAFAHEIAARPAVDEISSQLAMKLYHRAQQLDAWAGENYDGTSVLAGAKATKELGRIQEYRWAFGLDDMIMAVGYAGPVVIGVRWYQSMFRPEKDGLIRVAGSPMGGHAVLVKGVSVRTNRFRIQNSWGANWGVNGDCSVSFDDMDRLLHEQGECCVPVKRVRSY